MNSNGRKAREKYFISLQSYLHVTLVFDESMQADDARRCVRKNWRYYGRVCDDDKAIAAIAGRTVAMIASRVRAASATTAAVVAARTAVAAVGTRDTAASATATAAALRNVPLCAGGT